MILTGHPGCCALPSRLVRCDDEPERESVCLNRLQGPIRSFFEEPPGTPFVVQSTVVCLDAEGHGWSIPTNSHVASDFPVTLEVDGSTLRIAGEIACDGESVLCVAWRVGSLAFGSAVKPCDRSEMGGTSLLLAIGASGRMMTGSAFRPRGGAMLEITAEQLAAMEVDSEGGFRRRLFTLLCEQFPEYASDNRAVASVIDIGIADARAAGLRSERGLAAWVIAAFLLGLDIKDDPYVIAAIRESGDSEAAKADWLEGYVTSVAEALEG